MDVRFLSAPFIAGGGWLYWQLFALDDRFAKQKIANVTGRDSLPDDRVRLDRVEAVLAHLVLPLVRLAVNEADALEEVPVAVADDVPAAHSFAAGFV